jgi:TIGR03009 family protein
MRVFCSTIALLVTLGSPLAAQPPAPATAPGAPNPGGNRLDVLLTQWEQKMKSVDSLVAVIKRTETDVVAKVQDEYQGQLKFLRPNQADQLMKKSTNPQIYERHLCTGNFLYEFRPSQKIIRAHQLPQRAPGQAIVDNSFVGFLAGMSAVEARRRFELTLVKEDQWYAYIHVKPKLPEDKAEFSEARLALLLTTMMPAEMQFVPPNKAAIVWRIEKIDTNVRLAATDFAPPQLNQLPQGWQMQRVPPPGPTATNIPPVNAPPRIARPNGQ